jgi:hypothetical protein
MRTSRKAGLKLTTFSWELLNYVLIFLNDIEALLFNFAKSLTPAWRYRGRGYWFVGQLPRSISGSNQKDGKSGVERKV